MEAVGKDRLKIPPIDLCFGQTNRSDCSSCSYGPFCQFTTAYYGITSFQTILCSMKNISLMLVSGIYILASLSNLLAIGTMFRPKLLRRGAGIYRLWLFIIGQIGLTVLVSQIFLQKFHSEILNCYVLEYLQKALHASYHSLTACIILDRTMMIYKGIAFIKIGSCRVAKLTIPILTIYHLISIIYEPFCRHISPSFDRNWCVLTFPHHAFSYYYRISNLLHFILPYAINLIFPFFWILMLTKQKSTLHTNNSKWMNLKKVLFTYRYNIITTYLLVLLNTPRLITMLSLTCIERISQNTVYILAYFSSFIPLFTNLFIFVLLSPIYRSQFLEFLQHILRYRYRMQYNSA